MVQPPGSMLAAAVTDFLRTVQAPQPLVVARASFHTDTFLSLLRASGLRPSKVSIPIEGNYTKALLMIEYT